MLFDTGANGQLYEHQINPDKETPRSNIETLYMKVLQKIQKQLIRSNNARS